MRLSPLCRKRPMPESHAALNRSGPRFAPADGTFVEGHAPRHNHLLAALPARDLYLDRLPSNELAMTQERLAFEAEIDLTYLGGIERGKRNPSLLVMVRIAAALSVGPADLLK